MTKSVVIAAIACVGVICTGILSARAALKISEAEENSVEVVDESTEETTKDKVVNFVKRNWKELIFPVVSAIATVTCICISKGIDRKIIASLAGATGASGALLNKYKQQIREKFGESEYADIVRRIADDSYKANPKVENAKPYSIYHGMFGNCVTEIPGDTDILFYDEWSDRWFKSNLVAVMAAIGHLNRNLQVGGYARLNDFYELQNLSGEAGEMIGWSYDRLTEEVELGWIDISVYKSKELDKNGEAYYIISFDIAPANMEDLY